MYRYAPWGIQEIAAYCRMKRATVDMWRQRGVLPEAKDMSGHPYWWPDEIDDWAAETSRIPAFDIMVSDGSEENGEPAWIITDGKDSVLEAVPYLEWDTIHDGIRRFWEAGKLPDVELVGAERLPYPYPWQIEPYRWTLRQIRLPRAAGEWADALDAVMKATGMTAGDLISHAYAQGRACWLPVEETSEDNALKSGPWTVRWNGYAAQWDAD